MQKIKRIGKIVKSFDKNDIDNILLFKDENIYYATGFFGKASSSILFITRQETYLFVNFIFFEEAKKQITDPDIRIIRYGTDKNKELISLVKDFNIETLNFESSAISFKEFKSIEKAAKDSDIKLSGVDNLIENIRVIKEQVELEKISKACEITDKVFEQIIDYSIDDLRKISEKRLAFTMEGLSLEFGSDFSAFDFVVANRESSSLPHYVPRDILLDKGILLIDFGFKYKYYCSDLTRTVFIGGKKIPEKLKNIYTIVLSAQQKAVDYCKEGVSCKELDSIAREIIEEEGYGKNYGHNLGHGVGLEVHEAPFVSVKNDTILKENMVITIEPGIYLEGLGGVRIEDTVIVKKQKCENLFKSTKEFTIIR